MLKVLSGASAFFGPEQPAGQTVDPGDARRVFESIPSPMLILLPNAEFTIVTASDAYLERTLRTRDELVGKSVFEAFPDNPASAEAGSIALRASLASMVTSRAAHTMAVQRYDIPIRAVALNSGSGGR